MASPLARYVRLWACSAALAAAVGWFAGSPVTAADPPPPARPDGPPNALCLMCHGQPGLTTKVDGQERTVAAVDLPAFTASAHGEQTCVDCHAGQSALPHVRRDLTGRSERAAACAACHADAYDGYLESPHGTMAELRDASGPACADCHGSAHTVQPVREWTPRERAEVCAGCHRGARVGFLKALSHEAPSPRFLPSVYFAGRFLIVLASASLAFGIIHVELDLLRWLVRRWRASSGRRGRWEST